MELTNYLTENYAYVRPYIPIAAIGAWRWSVWLIKKSVGTFYKPIFNDHTATVSVITPVYNEDPAVFKIALESWAAEKPLEIIAVIDHTDRNAINVFKKFSYKIRKNDVKAKLIVTKKPGKREALADGIKKAKGEICALVDADTLWTKGVIKNSLSPFIDEKIGGVATRQNVIKSNSFARSIFDIQLDQRYADEMPFLAKTGNALTCLSGRTAFYRTSAIKPLTDELVNEYFMGSKVISGDDKRLTYLIQSKGWKTTYQSTALVLTPGSEDLGSFLKQRIRWGRNSWRANLKALYEGWVWKHRGLSYFILDQFIQPFTLLLGFFYLFFSIIYGRGLAVTLILTWWIISRAIKAFPHFKRIPKDLIYLPAYVLVLYPLTILKIYSLVTINTQGWITRWDASRLLKISILDKFYSYGLTTLIVISIGSLSIFNFRPETHARNKPTIIPTNIVYDSSIQSSAELLIKNADTEIKTAPGVARYIVQKGETLGTIATKHNITTAELLKFNVNIFPNWNRLNAGTVLTIPERDIKLELNKVYIYQKRNPSVLLVSYDPISNTIKVEGRGESITIPEIAKLNGYKHLKETEPGVWYLTANLYIGNGVTLTMNKDTLSWLKLASNKDYIVNLNGYNSRIYMDGIKVTSWDEYANDVDYNYDDTRAYILSRANGRMDIYNSELSYLGYKLADLSVGGTYGVSWRVPSGQFGKYFMTGEVINSDFHHNYFGIYTYGATGMVFKNNLFRDNVIYGLDPHDDSNHFLVENNEAYNNGHHGIIFSKRCDNNIIRNNISHDNGLHGIMLHENSNYNIVENNQVYNNRDGIALYNADNNILRNNNVYNNTRGVRLNEYSTNNLVYQNNITDTKQYGIFLYGNAEDNILVRNTITNAADAFYIKSNNNEISENSISNSKVGIYLVENAENNKFIQNNISMPYTYSLYSKTQGSVNILGTDGAGDLSENIAKINN